MRRGTQAARQLRVDATQVCSIPGIADSDKPSARQIYGFRAQRVLMVPVALALSLGLVDVQWANEQPGHVKRREVGRS